MSNYNNYDKGNETQLNPVTISNLNDLWTKKFEELQSRSQQALEELKELAKKK